MGFYDDLVSFLNGLDDFFIEVEGKPDQLKKFIAEYNAQTGAGITMNSDGICMLDPNVDKWGLEFRLYTNERPKPLLGNEFHVNRTYRPEYGYILSDNGLVKPLLLNGFYLGRN